MYRVSLISIVDIQEKRDWKSIYRLFMTMKSIQALTI
jgi:hypothetical protein